jgi:hypothetical protein
MLVRQSDDCLNLIPAAGPDHQVRHKGIGRAVVAIAHALFQRFKDVVLPYDPGYFLDHRGLDHLKTPLSLSFLSLPAVQPGCHASLPSANCTGRPSPPTVMPGWLRASANNAAGSAIRDSYWILLIINTMAFSGSDPTWLLRAADQTSSRWQIASAPF